MAATTATDLVLEAIASAEPVEETLRRYLLAAS